MHTYVHIHIYTHMYVCVCAIVKFTHRTRCKLRPDQSLCSTSKPFQKSHTQVQDSKLSSSNICQPPLFLLFPLVFTSLFLRAEGSTSENQNSAIISSASFQQSHMRVPATVHTAPNNYLQAQDGCRQWTHRRVPFRFSGGLCGR